MTDKLKIPDPATLSGEELNYWTGVAAGMEIWRNPHGYCYFGYAEIGSRWNPIEDAAQCLKLTPRCFVLPQEEGGFITSLKSYPRLGNKIDWQSGETELIARCRAYLASKRESDRRGE